MSLSVWPIRRALSAYPKFAGLTPVETPSSHTSGCSPSNRPDIYAPCVPCNVWRAMLCGLGLAESLRSEITRPCSVSINVVAESVKSVHASSCASACPSGSTDRAHSCRAADFVTKVVVRASRSPRLIPSHWAIGPSE